MFYVGFLGDLQNTTDTKIMSCFFVRLSFLSFCRWQTEITNFFEKYKIFIQRYVGFFQIYDEMSIECKSNSSITISLNENAKFLQSWVRREVCPWKCLWSWNLTNAQSHQKQVFRQFLFSMYSSLSRFWGHVNKIWNF